MCSGRRWSTAAVARLREPPDGMATDPPDHGMGSAAWQELRRLQWVLDVAGP